MSAGTERLRPSAVWYVVAGAVVVACGAAAIALAVLSVVSYVDRIEELEHVPVPGQAVVELDAGPGTIYFERIEREGTGGELEAPPLQIELEDPDGDPVPLGDYESTFTYSDGSREGVAVATYRADVAGEYRVRVVDLSERADGRVALGRSVVGGVGRRVAQALALGAAGTLVGGSMALVTAVRRAQAKRRRDPPPPWGAPTSWASAPPGPAPGTGWGPPSSAGWRPPVPDPPPAWGPPAGWAQQQSGRPQPPPSRQEPPPPP